MSPMKGVSIIKAEFLTAKRWKSGFLLGGKMLCRKISIMGISSLLFLSSSFAAEKDPVLAKVGDYEFRLSHYERLISYSPYAVRRQLREDPSQRVRLIESILQQKIIADKARKEKLDRKDDVREQLQYITNAFLAGEYMKRTAAKERSNFVLKDSELIEYYRANAHFFIIPEEVKVRHILFRVQRNASQEKKEEARGRAIEIYSKLQRGEDFARLAEQFSEDTATKGKGGDLGYVLRGQMEKPFDEAAFSLKCGKYSYVVETSQGYHLIFVDARIGERLKTFDEVRDFIQKQMKDRAANARANAAIGKALQNADLEIYRDEIVGKTNLIN